MSLACYFHTSIIHQIFECFFYLSLMNIVFDYERQGFVWFILILDFNLTICYLYFKILVEVFTNHILAENTYFTNHTKWTEHKIMVFNSANKCQIISQRHNFKNILINDFQHHLLPHQVIVLKPSFFTVPKITNCKDETSNHSNIYYLIYSSTRKTFL